MAKEQTLLSAQGLSEALAELPGWTADDKAIGKTFKFPDYAHAVMFANAVAHAAEKADHHPDIWLTYGQVKVSTWTHTAGGVTAKDIALARTVEGL